MAAACGLTVIKRFTYRGVLEEWSNQYWLTGGAPADTAAWAALWTAVTNAEKAVLSSGVAIVAGYGYNDDSDTATAVWSTDLRAAGSIVGTLTTSGAQFNEGDTSYQLRWKTSRTTSPGGKPIYLRKYWHPGISSSAAPDTTLAGLVTALNTFGALMYSGTLSGTRKITARGHDDVIVSHLPGPYITTRTLRRRGRRP